MKSSLAFASAIALMLPACAPGSDSFEAEDADQHEAALTTSRIVFTAGWEENVEGKLRAGDAIELVFDESRLASCRGEQNGIPQWAITAYYRVDGGEIHTVPVAGLNAGSSVAIVPSTKGTLEIWFEETNRWGCHAYDSNLGENYSFTLAGPVGQADWIGNGARVIDRWTCNDGGPCDASRVSLENEFTFGTWARQRAFVAGLYFDVWEEGVTDFQNPNLWQQVDAQVHFRFSGQEAFTSRYVHFSKYVGNDARYELRLRTIDPFFAMPSVVSEEACPAADLTVTADGQYVSTDVEYYFSADGVELRAEDGGHFVGHFEDYVGPYAACL